ncbi:PDZ domain-containing protein [Stieleria sp.]|uniref:PDZ domain-containing protein n=1 Tax=Stieleria sp. TaxID=2795976 RepID=UPI0035676238
MRSLTSLLTITTLIVSATCFADDARGQGLLQRLRSRIVPLIQDQLQPQDGEAANNALPARPLPRAGNQPGAAKQPGAANPANGAAQNPAAAGRTDQANPRARYRPLARPGSGVSRIPAVSPAPAVSPTPAVGPGGVRQAGAETQSQADVDAPAPQRSQSFGRSILSPLDFDDEGGPAAEPAGTESSGGTAASIGIKAIDADPGYPGVQITEFASHSRADREGLRVGDFIFAIDGVPTPSVAALVGQVAARQPGDRVRLRIGRGGQVSDLDITLVAKPGTNAAPASELTKSPAASGTSATGPAASGRNPIAVPLQAAIPTAAQTAPPKIGAEVRDVPGRRGVQVMKIQPGSSADKAGLKTDDRIVAIDSKMVSDTQRLFDLLALASPDDSVDLQLIRDNRLVNATLSLRSGDGPTVAGQATDATDPTPAASDSLVGGLGSVLGGMFGQSATPSQTPSNTPDPQADTAKQAAEPELLPAAKKPQPQPESKTQTDPSGESESVRAEIQRLRDQLQKLESQLED